MPPWRSIDCHRLQPGDVTIGNSHLQYLWKSSPVTSREEENENKWWVPLLGGGKDRHNGQPSFYPEMTHFKVWHREVAWGMVLWTRSRIRGSSSRMHWFGDDHEPSALSSVNKEVRGENEQPFIFFKVEKQNKTNSAFYYSFPTSYNP